jgi:diguanylate cyclase (GGDEF)-like protein
MRQNYNLFLLIIDVDKFKGYNDKHGHLQGDSLLITLARIIRANIRKDVDSAYRYGGDEFAVVLPYANQEQALKVAKRLLTEYNKENLSPTSLSIGLAKLEGTQDSLEEDLEILIKKADQALYLAKHKGGNQVCDEVGQVTLASPYIIQHDL